jgi:mono/diheme cytochrome c family protein
MSQEQNDYNRGGLIAFALSMAASILVLIYVSFFSGGVDLKEVPQSGAEGVSAAQAQASAEIKKVDVSGVKDPWNPSDALITHGKELYQTNCAMCHGSDGKGDGPAGASLNPKPRNFVEGKWKKGGTRLGLFAVLQEGLPGGSMQSYKHLPVADRWSLVHYIRSITQNKVPDRDADVAQKAPALN